MRATLDLLRPWLTGKKGAAAMPIVFGALNDTQIGAGRALTSLNAHSVFLPTRVSDLQRAVHATRSCGGGVCGGGRERETAGMVDVVGL